MSRISDPQRANQWQRRLERFQSSGLTVAQFCQNEGYIELPGGALVRLDPATCPRRATKNLSLRSLLQHQARFAHDFNSPLVLVFSSTSNRRTCEKASTACLD